MLRGKARSSRRQSKERSQSKISRVLREQQDSSPFPADSWPDWLISDSTSSQFVHPDLGLVEGASACEGVRPTVDWSDVRPPWVVMHQNRSYHELDRASVGELPVRGVVWYARQGMGASLGGLCHVFIFALLSSRQLLLSTGGVHGVSIKTLYQGFRGALDWTEESVPKVHGFDHGNPDLADGRPVLQAGFDHWDDTYWWSNIELRRCVYASTGCSSAWCVHSRIMSLALSQPRPELGAAIEETLVVQPPLPLQQVLHQQQGDTPEPTGTWGRRSQPALNDESHRELLEHQLGSKGLRVKFDIALHVRTYHKCVENPGKGEGDTRCRDHGVEHSVVALDAFPKLNYFVSEHRWACVSNLLGFLLKLKGRRMQEQGAHEGFFRNAGSQDKEELAQYLRRAAHLPGVRPQRKTGADRAGKWKFLEARRKKRGMWVPEDAMAIAEGVQEELGPGGRRWAVEQGLNIFLSTDSDALRPLFVEYLRPFGTIAHSNAKTEHLSFLKPGESSTTEKLQNLGQFYLMSRASMLVAYNERNSSYALMAATYGNNTLIRGVGNRQCDFVVQHIADSTAS